MPRNSSAAAGLAAGIQYSRVRYSGAPIRVSSTAAPSAQNHQGLRARFFSRRGAEPNIESGATSGLGGGSGARAARVPGSGSSACGRSGSGARSRRAAGREGEPAAAARGSLAPLGTESSNCREDFRMAPSVSVKKNTARVGCMGAGRRTTATFQAPGKYFLWISMSAGVSEISLRVWE